MRIKKFLDKRYRLVKRYVEKLKKFKNCSPAQNINYKLSANHLFVVKIDF